MKYTLTLSAFFAFTIFHAQTLNWSSEVTVANGSTYGNVRPRVVATSNNIPLVMWGGGTNNEPLYTSRWNGSAFGMPMAITPNNVDPFITTWAGSDIASNGNTVFAVFKVQPEMSNYIYIVKSIDGGVTWGDTVRVDGMQGPYDRFPSVAVGPTGNPAVMYMTFDTNWLNAAYAVTNSTDGGITFPPAVNVSGLGGSDVCDCCPGYMVIQGNRQVPMWRRNDNNRRDMWAGFSTDGGLTFSWGQDMDATDWILSACPSNGPHPYLWNDSLCSVWMSGASGDERIYLSTYDMNSQTAGYQVTIAGNYSSSVSQTFPFIAGNGDTLVVVWQQLNAGNTDTYFSWSTTGTAGLVNNEAILNSTTANSQMNPHVAYSNGTFHFVFTDLSTGNVKYKSATIMPNGINDAAYSGAIHAFPNPVSGTTTLDLTATNGRPATVHVMDATGKIVESISTTGESRVALREQEAGLYLVEVTDADQNVFTLRIVFH